MATRIRTFDEWIGHFHDWQKVIGLDLPRVREFHFETKFGDVKAERIEFGDYRGERKWERVSEIPDQRIKDALLNLIVYQGDTEFASVEQQRSLFDTAPSDYDLECLARVMSEEMRHGWQMCDLLVNHFGDTGRIEAMKQLERRSWKGNRLLGSFNVDVTNWLDFFVYTQFVDRDGKFQLQMLSYSAFAPLGRSMLPMLKEESFHLGTGNNGLKRIVQAGKIPVPILQRYFNKWVPTAFDLFGTDHSSSAHWAYVWGLKGRFDEPTNSEPADREHLNEASRVLYQQECLSLVDILNRMLPAEGPKLYVPDLRFGRSIGDFKGKPYSVTGELLSEAAYEHHLAEVLPTADDQKTLDSIFRTKDWIAPK